MPFQPMSVRFDGRLGRVVVVMQIPPCNTTVRQLGLTNTFSK